VPHLCPEVLKNILATLAGQEKFNLKHCSQKWKHVQTPMQRLKFCELFGYNQVTLLKIFYRKDGFDNQVQET